MFLTKLKTPIFYLRPTNFDLLLLFLAPLLTTMNGIAIDLYAPSLPNIASFFHISSDLAKFSISMGLIGFAFGVFTLGLLADYLGRRVMILSGLFIFILASILAVYSTNISVFMIARFFQGVGVATTSMLARAMLLDRFHGKKLYIVMLYTTIAWGLGPVIAPFIGGFLQHHFNWQANFIAYAIYGLFNLIIAFLFMQETLIKKKHNSHILEKIKLIAFSKQFQIFVTLCGLSFCQFVIYNMVGVFIVERIMGYNAVIFGYSALFVGGGYFLGTLISRFLASFYSVKRIIYIGLLFIPIPALFLLGFLLAGFSVGLNLFAIIMSLVCLGVGMTLPSYIAKALEPFKAHAGTAVSLHGGFVMLINFIITSLITYLKVSSIFEMMVTILLIFIVQCILINIARIKRYI